MASLRSPDDLYDFAYMQDGSKVQEVWPRSPQPASPYRDPSPYTTALMGPAGGMAPAAVSRTRDGKPRIMDLNNLGLRGAGPQRQPTPSRDKWNDDAYTAGQREWKYDYPRNDRVAALQAGVSASPQPWRQEQRQRADVTIQRVQQAYGTDARGCYLPPDLDMVEQVRYTANPPRPMEPVPPRIPVDWEHDMALRARRATDRIQQEYVDELRWTSTPTGPRQPVSLANESDEVRYRMQIHQQLEEEQRQQERQRVRQEMFRPVPPDVTRPVQAATIPRHVSELPNTYNQSQLTEAELDEKRRQMLVQKKVKGTNEGKEGKTKKKKSAKKAGQVEVSRQETVVHQMVAHQPTAPAKDKENGNESYSKRKRRLMCNGQTRTAEASENSKAYAQNIPSDENHHIYYGSGSVSSSTRKGDTTSSKPTLIPRQTSQQAMGWNSETAKRGLGFKSKQRRESETEGTISNNAQIKRATFTPDIGQKWKKATFY